MKLARTSLTTRTTCRICGSPDLVPVLSLGDQYIAGAFAEPGGELPWHFMDEFLDRESEFLDRGGQFIVPMPEVRLLSRDTSLAAS
jgi:hypothetical protein